MRKPAFFRRKPILEELEPRILYSADAQTALLGADDFFHQAEVRTLEPAAPPSANTSVQFEAAEQRSHELVFIDKRVDDYQLLVDDLLSGNDGSRQVEIFLLDPNRDGLVQIGQVLAQRHDISAVHLISHGADGNVELGSGKLNFDTLIKQAAQIKAWGDALTDDADLLIYGCDVAEHADGKALVDALARLTGADVAASTNLTGNADLGGDWNLEYQTAKIEAQSAISESAKADLTNVLALAVDASSSGSTPNATSVTVSHTTSGSNRLMLVGISLEPENESVTSVTYNGVNLTLVGREDNPAGKSRVEIWQLVAPATGTHDVVVNLTAGSNKGVIVGVTTFTGVNQINPTLDFSSASGNSTAASTTLASATNDLVFGVVHSYKGTSVAQGGGQTEYWDISANNANGGGTIKAGAASVTSSWTVRNDLWSVAAVAVQADTNSAQIALLTPVQDSYLQASNPTTNSGSATSMVIDRETNDLQRALVQFDLSSIPTGATISSATMNLNATQVGGSIGIGAYQVLQSWAEASTTWNQRSSGSNWSSAGGTYNATATDSITATALGVQAFNLTGLVQAWSAGTQQNYGVLVGSPDGGGNRTVTYDSREGTVPPVLRVIYTLPANAAPSLDAGKSPVLSAIGEDAAAPVGAVGTLVSALVDFATPSGQVDNVTDVDAGALLGIAVTAADTGNGSWYYSTNNGSNWNVLGAVTNASARLLAADANTRLYFRPNADFNGTLSSAITFRAWDQTSGTAGATADTSTNGGTTAFSSATDTAALTVTAVNDAPVLADAALGLTVAEDAGAPSGVVGSLVSAFTGGISDPDGGVAKGIAIVASNESNGTWYYSTNGGSTWTVVGTVNSGSSLLLADNASTRLYFAPGANYNGVSAGALTIRAWDTTSGTVATKVSTASTGGITAFSAATDAIDVTVTAVNDAPTLGNGALAAVNEDSASPVGQSVGTIFSGQFTDIDAGASFGGIAVVGNTANAGTQGSWQYSTNGGTNWFAIGTVADNASALAISSTSLIRFVPVADYNGAPPALTVRGLDNTHVGGYSSTAGSETRVNVNSSVNGGSTAIAAATASLSTSITPVNDAPVLTTSGSTLTYTENQAATAVDAALTVSDVDSTNLAGATVTISANYANGQDVLAFTNQLGITGSWTAGTGILTLSGTTTVANYQTALRSVTYANTSDDPSVLTRTISVVVSDGGLPSSVATRDIAVSAVNDPPAVFAPAAIAVIEDLPSAIAGIVVHDVDAGGGSVTATFTVSSGTLSASSGGGVVVGGSAIALTLTGSISNLNAFLGANSLSFTTALDDTSAVTLGVSLNDAGNTGSGGPLSSGVTNVTLNVTPVDDTAPVANADAIVVAEGGTATSLVGGAASVMANDGGLSDTPVNVSLVTNVTHGTLTLNADGSFSYTHDGSENFSDSFSYRLTDNDGQTSTATVSITISPVSDATPVANADAITVAEGGTATSLVGGATNVKTNDSGLSDTPVNVSVVSGPAHASAFTLNADGSFSYTHDGSENFSDSFSYQLTDNDGQTSTATVSITISPVSDTTPVASDDAISVAEGGTATSLVGGATSVMANDSGLSDTPVNVSVVSGPAHASAFTLNADGSFSYTHDGSENFSDSFSYQLTDNDGQTSTATVSITISPVSDTTPVASDDAIAVAEGGTATALVGGATSVMANDSGLSDTPVNVSVVSGPAHASAFTLNADGSFSYTHDGSENFSDSFSYQLTDNDGQTSTATVSITISPVSDATPVASDDAIAVAEGGTATALVGGATSVMANDSGLSDTPVNVSVVSGPAHASAFTLNADGSFSYTHDGSENFSDSFSYQLTDNDGQVSDATVNITITPVSDTTPVANADAISVAEGGTATSLVGGATSVMANDSGLSDTPVNVSVVTDVTHGTLTLNADGSFSYTHDGSENFSDSFSYRLTDNDGQSSDATVSITISPVSDTTPAAVADAISVAEGGTATSLVGGAASVMANDSGLSDTPVNVSLVSDVSHGSLTLNADGTFSYVHDGSENFSDSFSYRLTDNDGQTSTATVSITISPVSDTTPAANADAISVAEGGTATSLVGGAASVMANDTGLSDTPVNVSLVTDVAHGSLTLNADGSFSYTHDGSENFSDSFSYQLTDNDGQTSTATVSITISPVSDATPVASDDAIAVAEGGTATSLVGGASSVMANDSGLSDTPVNVSVVSGPAHASAFTLNADGSFSYTHDGSENFADSFSYRLTDNDGQVSEATVNITISPVSDTTPVASDDAISVAEGGTATSLVGGASSVMANDGGLADTPVNVSLVSSVAHGTLTLNADGSFSYTHDGSENFSDSFSYRLTDNDGQSSTATVSITISPVSDATPVASDDAIAVAEGGTATSLVGGASSVMANDSGLSDTPVNVSVVSGPAHASAFTLNADGSFSYTHDGSENFSDSFSYRLTDNDGQVSDATINITITPVSDTTPVASDDAIAVAEGGTATSLVGGAASVMANDGGLADTPVNVSLVSGVAHGSLTLNADGSFSYTHDGSENFSDSFSYQLSDNDGETSTATVSITISPVSDTTPVASDDAIAVAEGGTATSLVGGASSVMANDTGLSDTPVNVSLVSSVAHGTLTLNADGSFSYTHDGTENFSDSFSYQLTDNDGQVSEATVNITITPVSDTTPVASDDAIAVAEGGTATTLVGGASSVMANDSGLSDTPVNVSLVSSVAHGTLTLNADGSFSYTHDGSENFSDSFTYRLTDNDGQVSDATVSISITPVSDTTPAASDDAISVAEGGTATTLVGGAANVKTNDTGLADSPVNVSLVSDVSHGTLTLNADGSFSYTHDGSENFSDSFSYQLTDNDGQVSDATVSISITPVSDTTPAANADAISVAEGGTATTLVGGASSVMANDTGLSDSPVNVSLVTDVSHGSLTLNADGTFSYTHDGSENFSDSFSYRLTDNDGQSSDATVSITISPVSDTTPAAVADAISVAEGGTATSLVGGAASVMANDSGLSDTPVNVSLVSDVSHGSLTLNADGTFSYVHDGSENFSDSFSYRLTDNDGQTSTATVSITISPVSDTTPAANADAISVAEGGTATSLVGGAASVMANDTGLSDTPVNVSLVTDVAHGSLTLNADGSFSYTHDGSENFSDSFSYQLTDNDGQTSTATVSITISPVSDATPVASDDAIAVAEGGTATSLVGGATNVKTNDTGLSDTPVNVSLVTDVSHGSLTLNADGTFSYVHDGSENFSDSFSYRLTDNDGQTSTATVSITISPVSDTTPAANADAISVAEGGTATSLVGGAASVMANDTGLSDTPVNVSLVTDVAHGSLTLNADGTFSYTHDGSENFSDSFTYRLTDNDGQVSDATVNITMTPVSDTTPVASDDAIAVAEGGTATSLVGGAASVMANDTGLSDTPVNVSLVTDVAHGSLTLNADGSFSYSHDGSENFSDSFSYQLTDNDGETSTATVSITISPVSDTTPVASDDAIAVAEGGTATSLVGGAASVMANDTGLSDTPVNVSLVTDVSHGSLTLNADGTFSYVHDGSENFSDSFSYRLTDNDGQSSTATVSITISPVSDTTPAASDDAISVAEGGTATSLVGGASSVMANDTGLSDTPVNVSLVSGVAHGSLTLNADGSFSYTHDGSENFSDSFSYRLTDNDGQTSTATVSITISPVSDTTPVASDDAIAVAEGGTATSLVGGAASVMANDTGLSDTPVNVSLVSGGVAHGSLTLNADGTFSYTHDGSENFSDSFSYRLTDNDGQTSNATVSISITPVSDTTPAALDDAIAVAEGGTATSLVGGAASVMANDTGLSDTPVNVSLVTDVAHGSLTLNADGTFSYVHDGSENFSDSFSYRLTDNDGQVSDATVNITMTPVSDTTPVASDDAIAVAEGGTATSLVGGAASVMANDTGLSDTPVNVSLVTDVAHGSLTLNADGSFSYSHDGSENFSDSFSYQLTDNDGETSTATVSITISPVSDTTPVASDDAIAVAEGGTATSLVGGAASVMANDTGLSDTPVNVSVVTDVSHGSLTLNADGTFSYVHDGSENFSDSFSYRLTDNDGQSSTATVSITISPVSDTTPAASDDAISVAEGGTATSLVGGASSVMANDTGLSDTPVNVSLVSSVAHGTLTLNADGSFSYTHDGSENFSDSFSYRLTDNDGQTSTATVSITISPVSDATPVASDDAISVAEGGTATSLVGGAASVMANDSGLSDTPVTVSLVTDVSHGTLTLNADGSFSYTHDGSENFSDSFSYQLTDNDGQTSTATVSIAISPVSDTTPVASDDAIAVAEGGTATSLVGGAASVMANDSGLSDTPVNVSVVSGPAHASAFTLNADGSFSYTHDGSENFSDSFSYQLTDNDGQTSTATVSITISPVSDTTPVANADAISVAEGGTATSLVGGAASVMANDSGLSDTPVNVSVVSGPAHASAFTLNADGSFSYTHDGSENFSDSFSYRLTDNDGQTSTATVSITISPVSDATPVANADAISVAEGGTATSLVGGAANVKTNDTGLADSPVNVSLVSDVIHGTLTLNADGTFSYLHDGSENFSDSFSYRLTDNDGQTSTATVSITISPVSDTTPVASDDAISVAEGGTATSLVGGATNVKTNDTGLTDTPVNVSLVTDVAHGTLTLNADGSFSYTHDGSENFSDSFSYRLTDNDGQTSTATVSITISPVSDTTPVANADAISVAEGGTATALVGGAASVMANDGGLSDTPVNVSVVSGPAHASAFTLNADGSFSYTHDGSENFSDSFSYRLTDNDGQTSTATVSITISPVSDTTPVASDDAISVAEGGTATSLVGGATNVKTNDTGLTDTPVNVSLVTDVSHGTLTLNADGSFSYTHDGSENFSDSFSYRLTDNDGQTSTATVSITISPVSDTTPVASDDAISVAEGGTATSLVGGATNVKTNDTGLTDTPVNVSLVTDVAHGTLTLNADGSFSYTHDGSENFSDSFSYRLTDNDGQTSTATVSITISPVSDTTPVANADAISVAEGGTATALVGGAASVMANDGGLSDTPVNVSVVSGPAHASAFTLNADGSFSYTHDGSENFSDSFSYQLTDNDGQTSTATVSITISPVSDATPVANADAIAVAEGGTATSLVGGAASVKTNDTGLADSPVNVSLVSDVSHGMLTLNADGSFSYTHNGSENFSDSFSYRLTDNDGQTSTATVSITISPVSDATPVANADAISVAEGGTATSLVGGAANVKTNDTGLADSPVNVSLVSDVIHGTLTLNADGTFSYLHDGSENFSDSFSYRLTDNDGQTSTATVSITISPVSDTTPVANADAISVAEGGTATALVGGAASVMANDGGLSDTPVNVSVVSGPAHASAFTLNADGSFSYTHDGSENFSDSFSYRLTDNDGQTSTATVSITISPVSDTTPVASDDAISVAEGGTATSLVGGATNVKTNDTGLTDTPVNVSLVTDVSHGTLTLNADGSFSYTHDGSENFSDSFSYRLTDNDGQTSTATVSITISPVSDTTPVASDDAISVAEGGTATSLVGGATNVKTNDTGLTDTPVNVSLVTDVSHGTLTLNADGSFSYTHDGSENFSDSFSYQLTDNDGQTSTATVSITISPVSDTTPVANADAISVAEGGTATALVGGAASVMANDGGLSDTPVNVSVVSGPAHASAFTLNADGSFSYTHDGSENFSDSFSYQLTDNDGQTSTATVSITISPVSDATPVANADAIAVAEGGTATSLVGGAASVKTNDTGLADSPVNVSLVSDVSHGMLTLNADGSFSYTHDGSENFSDSFSYRLTDNDGQTSTATVSITISPVSDNSPVITSSSQVTVTENTRTVVTVTSFDLDGDAPVYGIAGGADATRFTIDPNTGVLTFIASPDYENPSDANLDNTYDVIVRVSDGTLSDTQAIAVTVTDIDESDIGPVQDRDGAPNAVVENAPSGTAVGITAVAVDPDGSAKVSYSLDDSAGGRFSIDPESGVVQVADGSLLDFESMNTHTILVRATSTDGSVSTQEFTIALNDANEFAIGGVTDVNVASNAVDELSPAGTLIGVTAFASDADGSNHAVTYSLDDDGGVFAIHPASGIITLAQGSSLSDASVLSATITVRATSADGSFSTLTMAVEISRASRNVIGTDKIPAGGGDMPGAGVGGSSGASDGSVARAEIARPSGDSKGASSAAFPPEQSAASERQSDGWILVADRQPELPEVSGGHAPVVAAPTPDHGTRIEMVELDKQDDGILRLLSLMQTNQKTGASPQALDNLELAIEHETEQVGNDGGLDIQVDAVRVTALTLTVGVVWWALRISGLAAGVAASLPFWRQIDVLSILPDSQTDEPGWGEDADSEARREELAVADVFESPR